VYFFLLIFCLSRRGTSWLPASDLGQTSSDGRPGLWILTSFHEELVLIESFPRTSSTGHPSSVMSRYKSGSTEDLLREEIGGGHDNCQQMLQNQHICAISAGAMLILLLIVAQMYRMACDRTERLKSHI
jgi:hypothetical protein